MLGFKFVTSEVSLLGKKCLDLQEECLDKTGLISTVTLSLACFAEVILLKIKIK